MSEQSESVLSSMSLLTRHSSGTVLGADRKALEYIAAQVNAKMNVVVGANVGFALLDPGVYSFKVYHFLTHRWFSSLN